MSKLSLGLKDRLNVERLFPSEGSILEQLIIKEISSKVKITSDEVAKYELKTVDDGRSLVWNKDKEEEVEIELTTEQCELLKEQVRKLDQDKKVTAELLGLCLAIRDL